MDLMSMLMGSMGSSDAVDALSGKLGASGDQTSKLISSALPLLMKQMTQNASSQEGAQSLMNALSQHTDTKSMAEQIGGADEADGMKIIGHILGGRQADAVTKLTKETGMDESQVNSALSSLAPALLSGLSAAMGSAKKDEKGGFDLGGIVGALFGGKNDGKADAAAGTGNELLGMLTSLMK